MQQKIFTPSLKFLTDENTFSIHFLIRFFSKMEKYCIRKRKTKANFFTSNAEAFLFADSTVNAAKS